MHSAGPAAAIPPIDDASLFLQSLPFPARLPAHDEILNRVTTPYNADVLASFLSKHDLADAYPLLANNLRFGFQMGDFPILKKSVIFPNHPSAALHSDFIDAYLDEEIAARRMSGPFTKAETESIFKGPFQCSPIIIAVQPQGPSEPDKLRLCRHLSKSDKLNLSTNSYIDKEKFPTKFGTASEVAEIVSLLSSLYSLPAPFLSFP